MEWIENPEELWPGERRKPGEFYRNANFVFTALHLPARGTEPHSVRIDCWRRNFKGLQCEMYLPLEALQEVVSGKGLTLK
jgi:hypothetical protein